ncbi:MAG: serine hydrolase, partial [Thermomicrobiales bacterium]
ALLDGESGVYGVMVVDQQGLLRYSRNARLPFISASLYKLVLCADILRQVEAEALRASDLLPLRSAYFIESQMPDGGYDYDAIDSEITLSEALWATICVSSNVSAMALLALTSPEQMNRLGLELGLSTTIFASDLWQLSFWPPVSAESTDDLALSVRLIEEASGQWQVNLTSPADITHFMQHVMQGTLVSRFVSLELRTLLFDQQINDRMPALLPDGTSTAHKTGNLLSIVHDAGAIITEQGPVLLSMLSQGVQDEHHTTRLLQSIAAMVFAEFGHS